MSLHGPRNDCRVGAVVLSTFIDAVDWPQVLSILTEWSRSRESRYVCICNVHSVATAASDPEFAAAVAGSDLNTPDGAPVAWMLRKLGFPEQRRINGPDLMWKYCEHAETTGQSIFLYGGGDHTLRQLRAVLRETFPRVSIAGAISPPFRSLTPEEDEAVIDQINASGAGTVWVGLGCPKQEQWMAAHRGRIRATMVGVGAAFDYHAGALRRAPRWMQHAGLEWLHRLASEPRRLWRRYVTSNTVFLVLALWQLAKRR